MIKERLKRGWMVASRLIPRDPTKRMVVLCYHSIHPNKPFASATPELFADHLAWLSEHCECVPFTEVLQVAQRPNRDRPAVAITFDDGYRDNFDVALPLLEHRSVPATFFVTVGLLEQDPNVTDRFRRLRGTRYEHIEPLSWDQVIELRRRGMDVGTHSYSHRNLARLDQDGLMQELGRAKDIMEERVNEEVTTVAYPFGKPKRHFTDEVVEVVERVGYRRAAAILFRSVRASDSPFAIPRFFVTGDRVEVLADKVFGRLDLLGTLQERMPLWAARVISPLDFNIPEKEPPPEELPSG
jgi:peptidoglycan/xylan/chitin deacetylase (PgdA/CDA1 family)